MTTTKMLNAVGQFTVISMAIMFFLPPSFARANQRNRTLGKDPLGETLKEFRIRYPRATCGRAGSTQITAQNLLNSGTMDQIHCCLNDRDSLTEFSQFRILNLDDCAIHAVFWKRRLFSLYYMLDVRSVQIVLGTFEKLYGPPSQTMKDPQDATNPILVDWRIGWTTLELALSRVGGQDFTEHFNHPTGEPWLTTVCVRLWNSGLAST
jgi:hypothetical protein